MERHPKSSRFTRSAAHHSHSLRGPSCLPLRRFCSASPLRWENELAVEEVRAMAESTISGCRKSASKRQAVGFDESRFFDLLLCSLREDALEDALGEADLTANMQGFALVPLLQVVCNAKLNEVEKLHNVEEHRDTSDCLSHRKMVQEKGVDRSRGTENVFDKYCEPIEQHCCPRGDRCDRTNKHRRK
ncbi:hypothetical protein JZ751_000493 [Albula glossodonta]|uniref:Uncharacterized protein n=1 Tax=Albula glossodonta TaxID=121402 RepID=A0A8T2PWE1_9TELE|nr:hypothetical protein JZ751_000493 [Albula glossodonta]